MRETTVLRRSCVARDDGEGKLGPRASRVTCTLLADGSLELASSAPEFAANAEVLGMIANEVLACPGRAVLLADRRGDPNPEFPVRYTPPGGGVYFTVGEALALGAAVRRAAEELREGLLELAALHLGVPRRALQQVCHFAPDGTARVTLGARDGQAVTLTELAAVAREQFGDPLSGSARFLRRA